MNRRETTRWVILIAALGFLLCFRPISAYTVYTHFDDRCYMLWLTRLFGEWMPSCAGGGQPPGVVLAWLPAALLSWLISKAAGLSFVFLLPIAVGLLSYLYWIGSLWLLVRILQKADPVRAVRKTVGLGLLFLLNVPVLYYASHRTTMVHSPELFFSLLVVWLLFEKRSEEAFLTSLAVVLLRLNDLPLIALPLLSIFERQIRKAWVLCLSMTAGVVVFVVWSVFVRGYNSIHPWTVLGRISQQRLLHLLIGGDWGMIWVSALWLLCLVYGIQHFRSLSRMARLGLVWMAFELLLCAGWKGNGSDFGYRYLIGSYVGVLLIWLDLMKSRWIRWKQWSQRVLVGGAIWVFWIGWVYKETPEVTPYPTEDLLWTHPDLLWNSFKMLFDLRMYGLPLRHSPVGALYWSQVAPMSDEAFAQPLASLKWGVTAVLTVIAGGLVILSVVQLIRSMRSLRKV